MTSPTTPLLRVGALSIQLACACNAVSDGTLDTDGDAAVSGGAASAVLRVLEADAGLQTYTMTNVTCSYDGNNGVLRAFEGRYCAGSTCYAVRTLTDGTNSVVALVRRATGSFDKSDPVSMVTSTVSTTQPPTATINIMSSSASLTITRCPAS